MFGTTLLMFMVMLIIWETNIFLATAFLLFFGFIDMVYTSGTLVLSYQICLRLGTSKGDDVIMMLQCYQHNA